MNIYYMKEWVSELMNKTYWYLLDLHKNSYTKIIICNNIAMVKKL